MQRIPQLDGLRGIAILLVLIHHYAVVMVAAPLSSPLAYLLAAFRLAWSGVDLFFVLSGFLIGGILLDNRETPNYFRAFYARRIFRIFPLYYLDIALFFLLLAIGAATFSPWLFDSALPFWSYLTFTQNLHSQSVSVLFVALWLAPTWSLAVEEQFYLCIPLLIRYLPRTWLPWLCLGVIALLPIVRAAIFLTTPENAPRIHVMMFTRADTLLFGVLIAYLIRTRHGLDWFKQHRRWLYCGLMMLGVGLGFLSLFAYSTESFVMALGGYSCIALFYAVLLVLALLDAERLWMQPLRAQWLRQLGVISYGVYLIQLPVIGILYAWWFGKAPLATNAVQGFTNLIAVGLTVGVATLSWRYFESPLVARGQRVLYTYVGQNTPSAEKPPYDSAKDLA